MTKSIKTPTSSLSQSSPASQTTCLQQPISTNYNSQSTSKTRSKSRVETRHQSWREESLRLSISQAQPKESGIPQRTMCTIFTPKIRRVTTTWVCSVPKTTSATCCQCPHATNSIKRSMGLQKHTMESRTMKHSDRWTTWTRNCSWPMLSEPISLARRSHPCSPTWLKMVESPRRQIRESEIIDSLTRRNLSQMIRQCSTLNCSPQVREDLSSTLKRSYSLRKWWSW